MIFRRYENNRHPTVNAVVYIYIYMYYNVQGTVCFDVMKTATSNDPSGPLRRASESDALQKNAPVAAMGGPGCCRRVWHVGRGT